MNNRQADALINAGLLVGVAYKLDINALEEMLKTPDPDFRYTKECEAVIRFAKEVTTP